MLVLKCRSGVPDRVCTDSDLECPSGFGPSSSAEDAMRLCRYGAFSSHVRVCVAPACKEIYSLREDDTRLEMKASAAESPGS